MKWVKASDIDRLSRYELYILDELEPSYTEQEILEFVEWANQNYGYVEVNKWEGEEDSTYTTSDILSRYKSLIKRIKPQE